MYLLWKLQKVASIGVYQMLWMQVFPVASRGGSCTISKDKLYIQMEVNLIESFWFRIYYYFNKMTVYKVFSYNDVLEKTGAHWSQSFQDFKAMCKSITSPSTTSQMTNKDLRIAMDFGSTALKMLHKMKSCFSPYHLISNINRNTE